MPRPKKTGGPEPKKRSRNGCWPCKGRKIKCDELHPICQNCQRQGDTCDYRIRLNWEGRGSRKRESDTSVGQSIFSSTPEAPKPPTSSNNIPPLQNPPPLPYNVYQTQPPLAPPNNDNSYHASVSSSDFGQDHYPRSTHMFDPLNRQSAMYGRPAYGLQSRSASFERPRPSISESSRPSLPRLRSVDEITSSPGPNVNLQNYPSLPNTPRARSFMSPSTPPQFSMGSENSVGLNFAPSDHAPKRPRYDSIVRSPRSSFMLPPGTLPTISSGMVSNNTMTSNASYMPSGFVTSSPLREDSLRLQHPKVSLFSTYDSAAENARRKPSIESMLSGPSDYATSHRGSVSTPRGSFSDGRGSFSNFSNPRSSVSDYRSSFSTAPRSSVSDPRMSIGDVRMPEIPTSGHVKTQQADYDERDVDASNHADSDHGQVKACDHGNNECPAIISS